MKPFRLLIIIFYALIFAGTATAQRMPVVADSATHVALPNASVFDMRGNPVGMTDRRGHLPYMASETFPVVVRYLGFDEQIVKSADVDTIFLQENISELSEVVVESRKQKVLHILAYVREYSEMTTYTDTVFLFREKMVDFMFTPDRKMKFKGWTTPRVLTCRSYYHFSNYQGLDSVSDTGRHHFSWSDWMGMPPSMAIPERLAVGELTTDTLRGRYSPREIWLKDFGHINVDVDVLADTTSRRWVPDLAGFFNRDVEFDRFNVSYDYDYISGDTISPLDLKMYSYLIESNGRGHSMFRFNRVNEPFFVSTNAEVYILDKEYITVKEAKKWAGRKFDVDVTGIYEPMDAPELSSEILALVDRVNNLDKEQVRLEYAPDRRMINPNFGRQNYRIGHRALSLLKDLTGITYLRSHRKFNNNWNKFKRGWRDRNRGGE